MEGNETGMDFEVSIDEGAEAYSVIAVRGEWTSTRPRRSSTP